MAQLKDLIVTGPARIIGTLYAQEASADLAGLIKLPTSNATTTFLRGDGTWVTPIDDSKAPLDSPAFTGTPTAPTATTTTNNTQIATTEFVNTAISGKSGVSGGYAPLDTNTKIPTTYLPSYVDDVIEVLTYSALSDLAVKETGKIYVTQDENKTYRWSGTAFVEISSSLALGSTAQTAAAGNHTHSASYTPAGTITVNSAGGTTTVNSITAVGTLPTLTVSPTTVITGTSVTSEVMSFTTSSVGSASDWSAGTLPTKGGNTTVKTGDASYKFTGTAATITTGTPA